MQNLCRLLQKCQSTFPQNFVKFSIGGFKEHPPRKQKAKKFINGRVEGESRLELKKSILSIELQEATLTTSSGGHGLNVPSRAIF